MNCNQKQNDGFDHLKDKFVADYNRRKKQDEELSVRSLGEPKPKEDDKSNFTSLGLYVNSVGFDNDERETHHTNKYELMDGDSPTPIFRRGQPFTMYLNLNQEVSLKEDALQLVLCYGPNASYSSGTRFKISISKKKDRNRQQWTSWIEEQSETLVKLMIYSPPKCQVGIWRFNFTTSENDIECPSENVFYMLFNPWCPEDDVFLEDEAARQEYVLCDYGAIFSGTSKQPSSQRWVYGQFDYAVLPATILLIEKSQTYHSERGSAVVLARAIAAVINSNDDQGLVLGNWSENVQGGTAPDAWTGSTAIFEQYLASGGEPVKYGQCWVYAGCATTACRALGIPCRTITGFNSAHDTDHTLTIDSYFDQNGHPIGNMTYDMIWNYHSWNELWISRPDLPFGYDGWNVIDATPQTQSNNIYRVGPAPVKAVHDGDVGLQFDVTFVFSEVNADVCYFQSDPRSPWGFSLSQLDTKMVGNLIVTQGCSHDLEHQMFMEDITDTYKFPEGSVQEREVFYKALKQLPKAQKFYEHVSRVPQDKDVSFSFENIPSVLYGDAFEVSVSMENTSNELRSVDVHLDVSAVLYTGRMLYRVKQGEIVIDLQPKEKKSVKMGVAFEEYRDQLRNTANIKAMTICHVKQTQQTHALEDIFEIVKSKLIIDVPPVAKLGQPFEARFSFKNPTNVQLTNCSLVIEGPGLLRPKIITLRNVAIGEEMVMTVSITPKREGPLVLVGIFFSNQISKIQGNAFLNVFGP